MHFFLTSEERYAMKDRKLIGKRVHRPFIVKARHWGFGRIEGFDEPRGIGNQGAALRMGLQGYCLPCFKGGGYEMLSALTTD